MIFSPLFQIGALFKPNSDATNYSKNIKNKVGQESFRSFIFRETKIEMAYTQKFQNMANVARARVEEVLPEQVDALMAKGAIALDIRDKDEHDIDHIPGSLNISRGKLEMLIESEVPDTEATILCYCNAINRGALSADTLRGMGYGNAKFIVGGLIAYRALG